MSSEKAFQRTNAVETLNDVILKESPMYQKKRTVELAQQVLNARLNLFDDKNSIEDLFEVYERVLKDKVSEGCISSIQNSKKSLDSLELQKKYTTNLIVNKAESFLIIPIATHAHMFAGVIRKHENDKFKLTVVNKGARSGNPMFKEFVLDEVKMQEFLKNVSDREKSISKTYTELQKASSFVKDLPLKASEQKIGNCFIKEPETAIKFAVYTSQNIKNLDENLQMTPKWPIPTEQMHTLFIEELKKLRPEAASLIQIEMETYQKNKQFRKLINIGVEPMKAFTTAFNKGNLGIDISPNQIKILLKKINADTLRNNSKEVNQIVLATGDSSYFSKFKEVEQLSKLGNIYTSLPGTVNFISGISRCFIRNQSLRERVINTVKTSGEDFPQVIDAIKHDFHAGYLSQIGIFGIIFRRENLIQKLNTAIELYPDNHRAFLVRGIIICAQGDTEKGIKDIKHALTLKPDFAEAIATIESLQKIDNEIKKDEVSIKNTDRLSITLSNSNKQDKRYKQDKRFEQDKLLNF